jgi:hypothetical protein
MSESEAVIVSHEEAPWHVGQRILFRFAFCYIVLYYAPSVIGAFPGAGWLLRGYTHLWSLIYAFFHLNVVHEQTGSGDTMFDFIQLAAIMIFALTGGTIWTILDRRRLHYAGLHGWLRVLARYALAFALLAYGVAKIIPPTQFPPLQARQLTESYGQSSPMGLLWNFMGFSPAYTIFAGCAELIPAFLLLFRRTALLGSLLAAGVMLNVVMLNFCYDVPVKLYSLNLLLLAIFLALPEFRRLFRFFVLNRPVMPEKLTHPTIRKQWQLYLSFSLKVVVIGMFLSHIAMSLYRMDASQHLQPSFPLTSRGFHWIQDYPYNR